MIWFYWKDGNFKYYGEIQRASKLVLGDGLYFVCLSRENLVDVFLFVDRRYVARGSVKFCKDFARNYNLYVIPSARGNGYAKKLIQKRIDIARENGYNRIDTFVKKTNTASVKLQKRMKFKKKNYKTKYYFYKEF